jgi:tyrosine-protein kinase Etk/Wzc
VNTQVPELNKPKSFAWRGHAISEASRKAFVQKDDADLDLSFYVKMLRENVQAILVILCACFSVASIYALMAAPVYESTMIVYVEEALPTTPRNALTDLSSMFETKKAVTAEMELVRSRAVITPAVEKLNLNIQASPLYLPVVGAAIQRLRYADQLSEPGLFGLDGYVWGNESVKVSVFNVPEKFLKKNFQLEVINASQIDLLGPNGNRLLRCQRDALCRLYVEGGQIDLNVADFHGNAGARFVLSRRPVEEVVRDVQKRLIIAELGKQSGIIEVKLEANDPSAAKSILHEIGQAYIAQSFSHKSKEAAKSLALLDAELPQMKKQLEEAEKKYNEFRHATGTLDVAEETKIILQRAASAKLRQLDLQQKRLELLARFTSSHPLVQSVMKQLDEINGEMRAITQQIEALPSIEQSTVRMSRDIKLRTELYVSLANTAQQLRVASVSHMSNVRIVDAPVAINEPVRPRRMLIVLGSIPAGLLCAAVFLFIRLSTRRTVDDPTKLERALGDPIVVASIPHSDGQTLLDRESMGHYTLLAAAYPADAAMEALRSFRASLQFAMPRFQNNIVVIAGPTSDLGKSFVAANFAAVMAAGGSRVLLIDADVRKGRLHQYFKGRRAPGLHEAIRGEHMLARIVQTGVVDNVDFLPTGLVSSTNRQILMHADLPRFLKKASELYDIVIIDSPPVLGLADTLMLGRHAGAVFLVARAGMTTEREIIDSMRRLDQSGSAALGIIVNDVELRLSGYGYGDDATELPSLEID